MMAGTARKGTELTTDGAQMGGGVSLARAGSSYAAVSLPSSNRNGWRSSSRDPMSNDCPVAAGSAAFSAEMKFSGDCTAASRTPLRIIDTNVAHDRA